MSTLFLKFFRLFLFYFFAYISALFQPVQRTKPPPAVTALLLEIVFGRDLSERKKSSFLSSFNVFSDYFSAFSVDYIFVFIFLCFKFNFINVNLTLFAIFSFIACYITFFETGIFESYTLYLAVADCLDTAYNCI